MTDPIEVAAEQRQQIADAIERLEAAANAWRTFIDSGDMDYLEMCQVNLIECVDELARLRGE